jgi:hypothetical protein
MDRDRAVGYVAAMTDDEYRQFTAEARPPTPTDPVSARASIAAKTGQLLNVVRDENGAVGAWSAVVNAAAARQPAPQPAPQPEPPAQQGFTANRAQGASGDGPPAPVQQERLPNPYHRITPPGGAY